MCVCVRPGLDLEVPPSVGVSWGGSHTGAWAPGHILNPRAGPPCPPRLPVPAGGGGTTASPTPVLEVKSRVHPRSEVPCSLSGQRRWEETQRFFSLVLGVRGILGSGRGFGDPVCVWGGAGYSFGG